GHCSHEENVNVPCPKVTFDYIDLSLNWPPGMCLTKKCKPYREKWSIHGTWPQNAHGRHPESCCFHRLLNQKVIDELYEDLSENWSSLYGNNKKFWQHEWEKHGTCSYASKQLLGQENYFKQTLKLFKKIDLNTWLAKRSINPKPLGSKSEYKLEDIRDAIRDYHGKRVRFACGILKDERAKKVAILQGVHLCFDKVSLEAVDCLKNDSTECGNDSVHFILKKQ
ncbi:ribonuclease Oy-like protein, partial [Leptotrombidium deliense]